jgi:hypothetical protein
MSNLKNFFKMPKTNTKRVLSLHETQDQGLKMSLNDAEELADKSLKVFQALKKNLVAQPDPAAKKLADVLKKIAETFEAINDELDKYLTIGFDISDQNQIREADKTLTELEGGKVETRVNDARVHCAEISSIYDMYLDKWFTKAFKQQEYETAKNLFNELCHWDNTLEHTTSSVGDWLSKHAEYTHDLLLDKKYDAVIKKLEEDKKSIRPTRKKLRNAIKELGKLQAKFIKISDKTLSVK